MKRSLLITFAVLLVVASQGFAQGGSVGIFGDPLGGNCSLVPPAAGLWQPFLVHNGVPGPTGGWTASAFKATIPTCAVGVVFLADISTPPLWQGTSQNGVSAGYGLCVGLDAPIPFAIAVPLFQVGLGPSGCCAWPITPNTALIPPATEVLAVNCGIPVVTISSTGGTGIISANAALCPCNVVNNESTWGGIKELFRGDDI